MDWVRGEVVGHGSFGKVNLVIPKKQSTQFIPSMVVKSSGVSHSASLVNEKKVFDELNGCSEIVRCFGESYSFENGEKLYNLLLEYVSGGSLAEKLKKSENHKLSEFEVSGYTKGILSGLQYVHKIGYVHCDIKLQNILVGEDGKVKIADFGLAKSVGIKKDDDLRCELRGTPLYMSPEMITGGEQGTPADIWALGCVVAEMIAGVPAYRFSNVTELLMAIGVKNQLPQIPEELSEEGKDFLNKCFVKDPAKRWTAEMLLKHPFVVNHDTVTFNEEIKSGVPSISPKCPFDFPDWVSDDYAQSSITCSITFLPSPENQERLNLSSGDWSTSPGERLRGLVTEFRPESEWCSADDWVTVK
ncbi:mitogen-activated protein kinase kinase kinase 20-like [Solanum dulcamara]|uniref:mitogen-activated protein kinase kinase kinase 20-like n=1 Tax=Solanum dulcamara TaxID=45834 RepID=UPI002486AD5B|nr:mitogen-activated protein kinase kinase kinase 20-like [Solanum dulcamara]